MTTFLPEVLHRLRHEVTWAQAIPGHQVWPFQDGVKECLGIAMENVMQNHDASLSDDATARADIDAVRTVMSEQYPDRDNPYRSRTFSDFNDHPDTIFADIELVLKKAIAKRQEAIGG